MTEQDIPHAALKEGLSAIAEAANDPTHPGPKTYGISWAQTSVLFKARGKAGKTWLGICLRNRRVAFLGSTLHALIVRDTYVDEARNWCEESRRCLDLACPLNKTTWESWARANEIKGRRPKNWGRGGVLGQVIEVAGPERGGAGEIIMPAPTRIPA